MKNFILENGKKFFIHPVYKKYAANEDGEIMNIRLRKARKGNLINNGYLKCGITTGENKIKSYLSHRFVFECFYGLIEKKQTDQSYKFYQNGQQDKKFGSRNSKRKH